MSISSRHKSKSKLRLPVKCVRKVWLPGTIHQMCLLQYVVGEPNQDLKLKSSSFKISWMLERRWLSD